MVFTQPWKLWLTDLDKHFARLKNVYFNALLFAARNLPGNLLSAYFMDRIASGKLLTWYVIASSTSLMTFAASAFSVSTFGIVASACLFQCFSVASWCCVDDTFVGRPDTKAVARGRQAFRTLPLMVASSHSCKTQT